MDHTNHNHGPYKKYSKYSYSSHSEFGSNTIIDSHSKLNSQIGIEDEINETLQSAHSNLKTNTKSHSDIVNNNTYSLSHHYLDATLNGSINITRHITTASTDNPNDNTTTASNNDSITASIVNSNTTSIDNPTTASIANSTTASTDKSTTASTADSTTTSTDNSTISTGNPITTPLKHDKHDTTKTHVKLSVTTEKNDYDTLPSTTSIKSQIETAKSMPNDNDIADTDTPHSISKSK
eukprot:411480_1